MLLNERAMELKTQRDALRREQLHLAFLLAPLHSSFDAEDARQTGRDFERISKCVESEMM